MYFANVGLRYCLGNSEAMLDSASICQWHQRMESCIERELGLDNPHSSFLGLRVSALACKDPAYQGLWLYYKS